MSAAARGWVKRFCGKVDLSKILLILGDSAVARS